MNNMKITIRQGGEIPIFNRMIVKSLNTLRTLSSKRKIKQLKMKAEITKREKQLCMFSARKVKANIPMKQTKMIKRKKSANLVHSSAWYTLGSKP